MFPISSDYSFMEAAMEEAHKAAARDEVPIGAVIVHTQSGEIIARGGNRTRELNDPTAHAEMVALRAACAQTGAQRIPGHTLYVTLEPCTMCAAALSFARVERIVIGAKDEKGGGVFHGARFYDLPTCHHRPAVETATDEQAEKCGSLLVNFFQAKRKKQKEKKKDKKQDATKEEAQPRKTLTLKGKTLCGASDGEG